VLPPLLRVLLPLLRVLLPLLRVLPPMLRAAPPVLPELRLIADEGGCDRVDGRVDELIDGLRTELELPNVDGCLARVVGLG